MSNLDGASSSSGRWSARKLVIVFIVLVLLVVVGVVVWGNYLSPTAREARRMQDQYNAYLDWQGSYEEAMRADTYGGATPQETLSLFIDALEKGDLELASQYFILREDGTRDPKWLEGLLQKKNEGSLGDIIQTLKKAVPAGSSLDGYFGFEVREDRGILQYDINFKLNKYSQVWKIENL